VDLLPFKADARGCYWSTNGAGEKEHDDTATDHTKQKPVLDPPSHSLPTTSKRDLLSFLLQRMWPPVYHLYLIEVSQ
jgi:hypothetical protein